LSYQVTDPHTITARPLGQDEHDRWQAFLARSNNGTLFHDLDFLAYHPPDRFDTHHLVFESGGRLLALLPGATLRDGRRRRVLRSPYGATIGGLVLPPAPPAQEVLALVRRLVDYARGLGLKAMEIILPPAQFHRVPDHTQEFALAACGFTPVQVWLQHVIRLPADPAQVIPGLPDRRRRTAVRAAAKKGVSLRIGSPADLPAYHALLSANRQRHGKAPVHSLKELYRLYELVPDRLRLFLCEFQGKLIGGSLFFEHHPGLAHSFAPCYDRATKNLGATLAVTVAAMEYYAARGVRLLDMGGSTFDDYSFNPGVTAFKESLGGIGLTRTLYRWTDDA